MSDSVERDGFKVHLFSLQAQRLAYIRVCDSYSKFSRVKRADDHLVAWYCQRGGRLEETTLYGMSQDDPDVTPLRLCRFERCVKVPADWQAEGDVGVQDLPTCRVAAIRYLGDPQQEGRAHGMHKKPYTS